MQLPNTGSDYRRYSGVITLGRAGSDISFPASSCAGRPPSNLCGRSRWRSKHIGRDSIVWKGDDACSGLFESFFEAGRSDPARSPVLLCREPRSPAVAGLAVWTSQGYADAQREKGTRVKGTQKPKKTQKKVAQKSLKERRVEKRAKADDQARVDRTKL
jgi:hypothetical protein